MNSIARISLPLLATSLLSSAALATPTDVSNGEPYQTEINQIFSSDGTTSMNIPVTDVPAGKRLVIRAVNGIVYGPIGERYKLILLTNAGANVGGWNPIETVGMSFYDPEAKAYATIFTQNTYVNAERDDQGRILRASIVRSYPNGYTHPTFVRVTISGYLVDDALTRL